MFNKIRLLLLIHPFSSSFFFPCNFQILKFSITFFTGTARPRSKLDTHVDNGYMYYVYWNQAAVADFSLYFYFFSFKFSNN